MPFSRTLRRQTPLIRGDDVKELQQRLLSLDFSMVGSADGLFGGDTEKAVKSFQAGANLPETGVVDESVWNVLFRPPETRTPIATGLLSGLTENHNFNGGVNWRLDTDGIRISDVEPEDTGGRPQTMARIFNNFGTAMSRWAAHYDVPIELIAATICTETRGKPGAVREESGYVSDDATPHRVSPGLMQVLISTARETLREDTIDRAWLLQPDNAIQAGTAYIARQKPKTNFDPPKVACAYNAGGVYPNDGDHNRWKMRQYPIGTGEHADRYVAWFNDCFRLFREQDEAPSPTFFEQLNGS